MISTACPELYAQTGRHPAYAQAAENLTEMLRGLVIRWETLDFSATAACFSPEDRMQLWNDAQVAELLPAAYERQ